MATATPALPPMPEATIPLGTASPDGKTIMPNPDWYRYLKRLDTLIRALRLEIP
jgi:hypothetical protein